MPVFYESSTHIFRLRNVSYNGIVVTVASWDQLIYANSCLCYPVLSTDNVAYGRCDPQRKLYIVFQAVYGGMQVHVKWWIVAEQLSREDNISLVTDHHSLRNHEAIKEGVEEPTSLSCCLYQSITLSVY